MRLIAILLSFVLLTVLTLPVKAGHSMGNNTCDDDKLHYENMIVNGKRDDAPLIDRSKEIRDQAHTYNNIALCEKYMEEALRMIRRPYPTE